MYKHVLLFACLSAVAYGAVSNDSPKTRPNVWDIIMVRGANGQLQSFSDSRRETANGAVCEDCKKVVKYIAIAVKEGAKLEEFKSTLKLLCDLLSGDEQQSCKNIIDNLDVVLKKLEPLLKDPTLFCEELALCSTTNVPRVVAVAVRYLAARTEGRLGASDVLCDECQFVITELKQIVQQKGTEQEVKESFENLCSYLGGQSAERCKSIIDQYFPLLWAEIIALMQDSKALCVDLELCQANTVQQGSSSSMMRLVPAMVREASDRYVNSDLTLNTPRLDSATRFLKHIQTREGKSASCFMCQVMVNGLVEVLQNSPEDQAAICAKIQGFICDQWMPSADSYNCNDWFTLYLPAIVEMTITQLGVMQPPLCQKVNMCTASDLAAIADIDPALRNDVMCESCTLVSEFLQHEIEDESVQTEIKSLITKACNDLPQEMVNQCKSLVETYVPAALDTIAQYLNPQNICTDLRMCPSASDLKKYESTNDL